MNHVILVEDDPDDIYFFREVIKKSNLEVRLTVFEDGATLFDYLIKKPNEQYLILLDLNMPRMGGLETLKKLNSFLFHQKNIIIVYTTSTYEKNIEEAYDLGASSYVIKPDNQKDLSELLNNLLQYWLKWNQMPRNSSQ